MGNTTSRPTNDPNWERNLEALKPVLERLLHDAGANPGEQHTVTIPAKFNANNEVIVGEISVRD